MQLNLPAKSVRSLNLEKHPSERPNSYQLLHQYHKILAACNIQGERACEFSFIIAQSQYFVVLMQ